jgi:hypothetical protein
LSPVLFRARVLAHRRTRPSVGAADVALAGTLQRDAACITSLDTLGFGRSAALMEDVDALLPTLPDASSHEPIGDPTIGRNTSLHCFSVDPPELAARCPNVLLWGLEERLLDLIESYIGLPVAFTTVHLRKDIGSANQVGTRIWHIDTEDHRVVRVLVYLNDVDIDGGPFEYIPRQHAGALSGLEGRALRAAGDPILDIEMRQHVPEPHWQPCIGPRGTVVIADNAVLYHHGRVHDRERLAIIYTYTSRKPRYPKLRRNAAFDDQLSARQRECFFVDTGSGQ